MKRQLLVLVGSLAVALLVGEVRAATLTNDTLLAIGNTTYDGQDIVLSNCTLTVNGPHSFNSLRLTNNAVLTHSPAPNGEPDYQLNLAIAQNVTVDASSRIEATARGYAAAKGPGAGASSAQWGGGGGSHGGLGGTGSGGSGGEVYDAILAPTQPGSGGGDGYGSGGGAGGGVIRMVVGGTLRVEGAILAEGGAGVYYNFGGGGAGGTIVLTVGTITGFGRISANGGTATGGQGGGGGGGCIAVFSTNSSLLGAITAYGGAGQQWGGAGTVFTKAAAVPVGEVRVDNGGRTGQFTPLRSPALFNLTIANRGLVFPQSAFTNVSLTVKSNGLLTHLPGQTGFQLTVLSNLVIEPLGHLDVSGQGNEPAGGPGAGTSDVYWGGGGGGHGGVGGTAVGAGGGTYDSIVAPSQFGSGGGNGYASSGGGGGGAVRLLVGGTLQVDGVLSADGRDSADYLYGGGGAGGSLWLTVGALRGVGSISADGGASLGAGGGGAGGRIAIYHDTNTFTGRLSAAGGVGAGRGGAGTIFSQVSSATHGTVLVHNGGNPDGLTRLNRAYWPAGVYFDLTLGGAARVIPEMPLTFWNLTLNTGAVLTHDSGQSGLDLTILADARLDAGTAINANSLGHGSATGLGAGGSSTTRGGGGAGHGGGGGTTTNGAAGGATYGAPAEPTELGSGGGAGYLSRGGFGGGALRLTVGGLLQLNGALTANGGPGLDNPYGGGGSGGSIYVTADILTGSGTISAHGGSSAQGGGGGGGLVAIYPRLLVGFPNPPSVAGGLSGSGANTNANGRSGLVFWASNVAPLKVVSLEPSGVVGQPVGSLNVLFSSPLNPATFSAADLVLTTPTGPLPLIQIVVTPLAGTLFNLSFPLQTNLGTYQLQVGPHLENLVGREMDQNGNLLPGEVPGDVFYGSFTLTRPTLSGFLTATNGWPIRGATVRADDHSAATTTDQSGFYTLALALGWAGGVTPSAPGCAFTPASRSYASLTASLSNQNFTLAADLRPTLAVGLQGTNLQVSWPSIPGFHYQLKASTNLTAWPDFGPPLTGTGGRLTNTSPISPEPRRNFRLLLLEN